MSRTLVVGLGNPLAGDDGVGWQLAERLRDDPRLPASVEVLQGADLLRLQTELAGRERVLLLDALLDDGDPGRVLVFDDLDELDGRGGSAHQLPPAQALALLRDLVPALRRVPVQMVGITVRDIRIGEGLSPALDRRVPGILDELVGQLLATPRDGRGTER